MVWLSQTLLVVPPDIVFVFFLLFYFVSVGSPGMASIVDTFVDSPSVALLDQCTKDQLLLIAEKYEIEILDKRLKESVKGSLMAGLLEQGMIQPVGGVCRYCFEF